MNGEHHHHVAAEPAGAGKVRDPVCGMMIDPARAAAKFDYKGTTYYFCNPGCLKKFQAQPDVYLSTVPVVSGMQLPVLQPAGKSGAQLVTLGGVPGQSKSSAAQSEA